MNANAHKKQKNIRLTPRDLDCLFWINAAGFVTITHIATFLNVTKATAYVRAQKLVQHGYLSHTRVFHGCPGIYRVTAQGVQVSGSELPLARTLSLATYRHDLLVTTLSFVLQKYYNTRFITERELRHQGKKSSLHNAQSNSKQHTPDGILILDSKKIAIEVELTQKSARRLESIYHSYLGNFDYQEVRYFCGNEGVKRQLETCFRGSAFLKTYLLHDFLKAAPKIAERNRDAQTDAILE